MHKIATEEHLERMEEIYSYIKDENAETNESIITILGKNFYDEDLISNYFSYILNPNSNGIGYLPLYNFLEMLNIPTHTIEPDHLDIQREYLLPNNRRIDFLITLNKDHVIAIEHKVFSGEHRNQTIDYECELRKVYESVESETEKTEITYVFLSPYGKHPLNDNFIPVSYAHLVKMLREIPVDFTRDVRKAVFFHEFISHLEGYFLNNQKLELSKKSSLYMKHLNTIKDLEHQFNVDYHNIFHYIKNTMKQYFEANVEGQWEFDFSEKRSYHQIYKPSWKSRGLDIHFELKLDQEKLVNEQLIFQLDIEGAHKKDFEVSHSNNFEKELETHLDDKNILCKGSYRGEWKAKYSFAEKTYHILSPEYLHKEDKLKAALEEMVEDFRPFIDIVDKETKAFSQTQI
ncbi:PD-(D/E)XK nuclease family protein [Salimicrobium humidisoli]|uniref:PD-(D/E)XK nuclease superfamily protein n=1 Tax=Salimicrobium humidisoli TaxID=2029857 RepID=A0ABX4HUR6_9BACI|nr:PD-(D/E)XK nuclease family protein [Salimicrobium humidisoli]PBB06938.1 hypothetical protein CKW00_00315 [Salimicrobium humidisoli]